jgi:HlyD family secretion protein
MRRVVLIIAVLALAGGGWWALRQRAADKAPETSGRNRGTDAVAKVERRDIESVIEVTGDVTPASQIDVKPEVGGKIKRLHLDVGATVKRGDLLVEIDDTDLLTEKAGAETEIAGTRLEADKNRRNFERGRALFEKKLVSQEVFDNLKSELDIAENAMLRAQRRLQTVEDRLRKTLIRAPANGVILSLPVTEGQVVIAAASVNSGTTLMTIADLSRLLVVTHINQVDIAHVAADQHTTFRSEALPGVRSESTISFVAPVATVKNNVKGFQVEALIDNPDPRLRPGMTVLMSIPVGAAKNVVSVPVTAIFNGENNTKVVYVRSGTASAPRKVQIGLTNLFHAEITEGLEPGEEVLLTKPRVTPS